MTLVHCLFLMLLAAPAVLVAARAAERKPDRFAWAMTAIGLFLFAGGFAWQAVTDLTGAPSGSPGLADVIWLAFYPFPMIAMFAFARPWLRRARAPLLLETLLVLLGTTALVTALVLPPVLANASELSPLSQLINSLYPLLDSVLLSVSLLGACVGGRRHGLPWMLMALGALGLIVGDLLWTLDLAGGTWSVLSPAYIPYLLWPVSFAAAAWLPQAPDGRGPSAVGLRTVATTLMATVTSILLLVANEWVDVPAPSVVLAALALLTAGHRSGIALAAALRGNLGAAQERELVEDVREALARQDLSLHYQPLVDATTGTVKGAEALLRWYRDGAFVPPDSFLGAVERSELMRPLTDFVLDRALETAALWWADGYQIGISVNLATANLDEADLPGRVLHALCHHRLPPHALTLEITETAEIHDNVMAQHVLLALHQLGVGLAVDDFGTGHSSLVRLAHFPISELKIDRSFVQDMHTSKQPIVATAIQIAQTLGLRVVAEGVEDEITLDALRELGCDLAQGYHVSRPLPAQEFESWLYQNALPQVTPLIASSSPA